MYKDLRAENIKLKQTIEIMRQASMEQGQAIEKLKQSVTDLKRRLVRHDNYNTPPSQKKGPGWPDAKKSDDKNNGNNKSTKTRKGRSRENAAGSQKPRGGQKGHEGKTRRPKPTEFKEHTPDACPGCGSDNLSITKTIQRDITKVVRTVRSITTRHTINTCRCSCGQKDIESETGLPPRRHKKRGRVGQTQRRAMIKIMEIINPQKRARGGAARTRPAARNRAGGKRATRAKPAGQNPPSSRSTPRTPVPGAARTTSP
jgi:hypothetical protein